MAEIPKPGLFIQVILGDEAHQVWVECENWDEAREIYQKTVQTWGLWTKEEADAPADD